MDPAEPPVSIHRQRRPPWPALGCGRGRLPPPPAAVLLGFELLSVDPDAGTIEAGFTANE